MKLYGCVFETDLGWLGIAGFEKTVCSATIGHRHRDSAWERLRAGCQGELVESPHWYPLLTRKLQEFSSGRCVTFDDIKVSVGPKTEFQQSVLQATRAIEFGETISYGELAARVGSPRAARAVGAVMASNRIPIIIPCHRVVGSHGELTGFSAPRGLQLKQQLLEMEQAASEQHRKLPTKPMSKRR